MDYMNFLRQFGVSEGESVPETSSNPDMVGEERDVAILQADSERAEEGHPLPKGCVRLMMYRLTLLIIKRAMFWTVEEVR